MENKKVFGFDMGANSIGWCVQIIGEDGFTLEILGMGSRIFENSRDPKTRVPLSVERRMAHAMSVRRGRQIMRTRNLCSILRKYGLLPSCENVSVSERNPYKLRAKAVSEKVDMFGIGRAILHMNKRRGFKSNRKADKKSDGAESRGMKLGISKLREAMGDRTLGEFLYERKKSGMGTRMRADAIRGKNEYEIYADRGMYESELRRIWDCQRKYHRNLTDEMLNEISGALFFQRPLKIPERGFCRFEPGERRAYKAYPVSQKFRILQEVNALEILDIAGGGEGITLSMRQKLARALLENDRKIVNKKGIATFAKIKKFLGIPQSLNFNFESESRKGFDGDSTAAVMGSAECFGDAWADMDDCLREKIVDLILADKEGEFAALCAEKFGFGAEKSCAILDAGGELKDGTVSLSAKAMRKILPHLEGGALYHAACAEAGYDFTADYDGERSDLLPYYGKILRTSVLGGNPNFDPEKQPEKYYGKINNPTVHVALNQLRKVYNKLVAVYGRPDMVAVETARELPLGAKGLGELLSEQGKNRGKNLEIAEELKKFGAANNYRNRMKYKLWEDLNPDCIKRACPFCGRPIELQKLFTPEFEIEHLLPFSETFDDTRANKVVSCASCNRILKGNRSPYDAFANRAGYDWNGILSRVSDMPKSKQWRFRPDAWEIFEEKYGDYIARMLNDTRYMSKLAREYLTSVIEPEKILTVTGSATSMLRAKWGLDAILDDSSPLQFGGESESSAAKAPKAPVKNREDHRHHAIDAFVISSLNRKLISAISQCAKRAEQAHLENLFKAIPRAYERISYEKLEAAVKSINVSHKLDRGDAKGALKRGGTVAKLHKETAYGMIGSPYGGKATLAKRVPILSVECDEGQISEIANAKIRADLSRFCEQVYREAATKEEKKSMWARLLGEYCASNKIRRVRIHLPNRELKKLIPISDKKGKVYKYMENAESYCIDIYKPRNSEKWKFEVINMFAAHKNEMPQWRKDDSRAKLVMRLFKRDTIAYEENGEYRLAVVAGMATHGQISLLPLNVAKVEGNPPKKTPSVLQKLNARKVYVDEIGRVFDPYKRENERMQSC